jgi:hypothetical protein
MGWWIADRQRRILRRLWNMDACSHGMMTKVIFLGICSVVVVVGDGVGIADFERLGFCFPRAATSGSRELLRRVQGPGYVVTA